VTSQPIYLDADEFASSIPLILEPETILRRVLETVEVHSSSVVHRLAFELRASERPARVLLPLLRPPRGLLIDNFQLEASDADPQFTLNRQESQLVAAQLLAEAALAIIEANHLDPRLPDVQAAIASVIRLVVAKPRDGLTTIALLNELRHNLPTPQHPDDYDDYYLALAVLAADSLFTRLASFLRIHRLVFAPITLGKDGTKVSFSYEAGLDKVSDHRLADSLRGWFGFSPYDLRIEVPLALRTPSYHFRFRAPRGQYVRLQQVLQPRLTFRTLERVPHERWELTKYADNPKLDCFCEGVGPNATGYSHIYAGNLFRESNLSSLFVRLVINERPAGAIGSSLMKSVVVLTITFISWLLGPALLSAGNAGTFAIPLLVSIPGLYSLGGAIQGPNDEINFAPLSARMSLFVAGFSSIGAALLFLWWSTFPGVGMGGLLNAPVTPWFMLVLAVQVITVSWLFFRLCVNVSRYHTVLRQGSRTIDKVVFPEETNV
jgi:hypothetical protein